jgi:hypothetical protein
MEPGGILGRTPPELPAHPEMHDQTGTVFAEDGQLFPAPVERCDQASLEQIPGLDSLAISPSMHDVGSSEKHRSHTSAEEAALE